MTAGLGPLDQAIVVLYLAGMLGVGVLADRSFEVAREAGLLIALPVSLAAFGAGWLADRRSRRPV